MTGFDGLLSIFVILLLMDRTSILKPDNTSLDGSVQPGFQKVHVIEDVEVDSVDGIY